ncbi:hypothetical protein FTUN_3003 [Frigoriglobus tundricola]|uniref:Uncharacterized protein n=1 Tax=Frigoriglobus tundricola TaxID=2774151 RepID=A0A6M5YPM3_9BACT|nr:hypothetical protein FTUN_3003 [Frigoriglobus tundricola]
MEGSDNDTHISDGAPTPDERVTSQSAFHKHPAACVGEHEVYRANPRRPLSRHLGLKES